MKKLSPILKTKIANLLTLITLCFLCGNTQLFAQNNIVTENALTGSPASEWDISGAGDASIQGFATDISVNKGETVHFKIKTTAGAYTINIYRIGYYQGNGARKVGAGVITATLPQSQPSPLYNATTGLTDCGNWAESAHWDVPSDAVSGVYIAKLTRGDTKGSSHIVFIVRDDASHSDLYFQTSDATWQAYNNYGGNSLYVGTTSLPGGHAAKVSYNRPFLTRDGGGGGGAAEDWLFNAEYPMIRFLERNGYDVTYTTDVDADRRGNLILNHKVYMSVGHDEYWSAQQRANVEAARNAGRHLAFFGGNGIYWKTRWESSTDRSNTPYRTLVCYKEGTLGENVCGGKCDPLSNVWTGLWRDGCSANADGCRPENALSGQISWDDVPGAIQVPSTYKNLRFWRNTSIAALADGETATLSANTLGYEWDWEQYPDTYPAGRIKMSSTTLNSHTHHLSLYRHSNGALVFGAGTVQWSWGLDGVHDRGGSTPDVRMQQATINLFADMGVQPASLQGDLVAATKSTDTKSPVTIITAPSNNANISVGTNVTITGTASDDNVLVGVEVSVDGGATWHDATGTTNWTYSWTASNTGTVIIKARGFDDSGNMEATGEGSSSNVIVVNVTGSQSGCPCTIFKSTDVPTVPKENDGQPIELGVKFRSSINGYITGIRFYKGSGTTGTHIGHLWKSDGTLLASATFRNETATGWQEVLFGTPVAITANTTYVASFFSGSGDYGNTNPFFTQAVTNGPLRALANGEDGSNGVYLYTAQPAFPTENFQSSNYYVDVVFNTSVAPDLTSPAVIGTVPAANATAVGIATPINATFNESIDPSTISRSVFEIRDASNNLIDANITYNSGLDQVVLLPTSMLAYSSTYTVTFKGGTTDPRIKDLSGNALASNFTWTFTTADAPPPPPTEGPGGPILIISSVSNPFSRYPVEILRAQGLNEFSAMDISQVTATVLDNYDVVIIGNISLSSSFVTALTNWVNAGGTLITFRPDSKLSSLMGITPVGGSLSDKYILVNTASGPGVGIVNQTIQYHGPADLYTLNGATSLATLYSNANTPTTSPAVTMRNVGSNGGAAIAFTYDLARSIVYTRQGNPAWAGQKRDGQIPPTRSDDMFFGNAASDPQQDWIDLDKVAIPQADEQQHLLANIINNSNLHKKPLPKFWFLPNNFKAAIVMTGDDHGNGGTIGRFDQYLSLSPSNTAQSVLDWTAIRATSYIFPETPISNAQALSFQSKGFEISLHLNTGCQNWTPTSLDNDYNTQLSQLASQLPDIAAPSTHRTHCIAWSDWASQPKIEASKGIRMDMNYYYWPGSWVKNRSGMFTGSGMPMRFADLDGSIIDCYQVATQMPDESDEIFPAFCDQLLDKATGPEGYYGVFCANMHTDDVSSDGSDAIIASARAHNVPVISAKQLLTWLDGRNSSSFQSIRWNVNTLNFSIDTGAGSYNLQAMLPVTSAVGQLTGIKRNGSTVSYNTQTIKGIVYAFFAAVKGDYVASYGVDITPPVIKDIVATPHADGTATITWNTDVVSNSKVDYNSDPNPLTLNVSDINLVTSHTIILSNLIPGATYHFRVTSVDGAGNSATSPTPPDSLSFTMPAIPCTLNATASAPNAILCNGGTTLVTVTATGGTLPYNGTGTFTAGSGTKNYVVTDKNGCSSTATITLADPAPIVVNASQGSIACFGGSTSVVVSATGGTGVYIGTGTFSNVTAGNRTYTVTDQNGCKGSTTIRISQPSAISVTASGVIKCNGGSASVIVAASGGTAPYTGTGTFSRKAGTYTFTVTDSKGCTGSTKITLTEPSKISVTAAVVSPIACNGGQASVQVTASGGTPPYTGTGILNRKAGSQTFTVTDSLGCTGSITIPISQPPAISVTATVVNQILCNGGTASVMVTATGGTPPYTGTGTFNRKAGSQTFTVTDSKGCISSKTITISQPSAITVTATAVSPIQCSGGTTSVLVSATGGTSPYTGTGTITGVSAGSKTFTVTDARGCSATKTINVPNGTPIPATPDTIIGQRNNVCGTGTFTYSTNAVSGATKYVWSAPAGLNIIRNDSTASIVLSNASSTFTTGTLSVAARNSCGTSAAKTAILYAVSRNPSSITGRTSVIPGQTNVAYSITNVGNVTFNWSVPPGATITSGKGTNQITVKFGSTSGNVSVYLSTACGKTSTSSLAVTVGSTISTVIAKAATTASGPYLKVYPNPTNSIAGIEFNSRQENKYELVVTDLVGKPIIKTSGIASIGKNKISLDMGKSASGMYLVTLSTEETSETIKLYKEK